MRNQLSFPALQFSFEDYARAEAAKQAAIRQVDAHAEPSWREYALRTVKRVAEANAEFTTDAVLEGLRNAPVNTHELRALGPVMLSAMRAGYITPSNRFQNSKSVSRHKAPKRIWGSCIYRA